MLCSLHLTHHPLRDVLHSTISNDLLLPDELIKQLSTVNSLVLKDRQSQPSYPVASLFINICNQCMQSHLQSMNMSPDTVPFFCGMFDFEVEVVA